LERDFDLAPEVVSVPAQPEAEGSGFDLAPQAVAEGHLEHDFDLAPEVVSVPAQPEAEGSGFDLAPQAVAEGHETKGAGGGDLAQAFLSSDMWAGGEARFIPVEAEGYSPALIDEIVRRVLDRMTDEVVRQVAWEVVPDCVERVIENLTRELLSKRG
jgi:hypothetical protein